MLGATCGAACYVLRGGLRTPDHGQRATGDVSERSGPICAHSRPHLSRRYVLLRQSAHRHAPPRSASATAGGPHSLERHDARRTDRPVHRRRGAPGDVLASVDDDDRVVARPRVRDVLGDRTGDRPLDRPAGTLAAGRMARARNRLGDRPRSVGPRLCRRGRRRRDHLGVGHRSGGPGSFIRSRRRTWRRSGSRRSSDRETSARGRCRRRSRTTASICGARPARSGARERSAELGETSRLLGNGRPDQRQTDDEPVVLEDPDRLPAGSQPKPLPQVDQADTRGAHRLRG